jgi:preprotein translocase subunit SecA
MINYLTKAVTKFFGTKSERDIKELMPIVENVKVEFAKLSNLTDNQLRQKTVDLKALIQERLAKYDAEISDFKLEIEGNPEMSVDVKENIFNQIDKLEVERNKSLEVVLMEILLRHLRL